MLKLSSFVLHCFFLDEWSSRLWSLEGTGESQGIVFSNCSLRMPVHATQDAVCEDTVWENVLHVVPMNTSLLQVQVAGTSASSHLFSRVTVSTQH